MSRREPGLACAESVAAMAVRPEPVAIHDSVLHSSAIAVCSAPEKRASRSPGSAVARADRMVSSTTSDARPTTFCGAPTIYRMFVLEKLSKYTFPSLRHCVGAGEPLNPEIIEKDGVTVTDEGCLSVPGYYAEVQRAERIRVRYTNRDGEEQEMDADGLLADHALVPGHTGTCSRSLPRSD